MIIRCLTVSMLLSNFAFAKSMLDHERDYACETAYQELPPQSNMFAVTRATGDVIIGLDNRYFAINETHNIASKQEHYINTDWEYTTTREFSYLLSDNFGDSYSLINNFNPSENASVKISQRGRYKFVSIAKDDKNMTPRKDVYYPLCDAIYVFAQERPKGRLIEFNGGIQNGVKSSIKIAIDASIDLYSKYGQESNGKPRITYTLSSMEYPSLYETYTTTSMIVNLTPPYNSVYNIEAIVSDGTYKKIIPVGSIHYAGGQRCTHCGPSELE